MLVDSKALSANLRQIANNTGLSNWAQQVLFVAAVCVEQAEKDQADNDRYCEVLRDIVFKCNYVTEGIENKGDYGRVTLIRIRDMALKVLGEEAKNAKAKA